MVKPTHKHTTLDDLARMINEGFKVTASKEDISDVRQEMKAMEDRLTTRLDHLDARVGRIEADIHELRDEIVYRHEFDDVLARVKYLEKQFGIERGVSVNRSPCYVPSPLPPAVDNLPLDKHTIEPLLKEGTGRGHEKPLPGPRERVRDHRCTPDLRSSGSFV